MSRPSREEYGDDFDNVIAALTEEADVLDKIPAATAAPFLRSAVDWMQELRLTNQRLNRRCQQAEAVAAKKLLSVRQGILEDVGGRPAGRTFGRMLANYAASHLGRVLQDLVSALDRQDHEAQAVALNEARDWFKNLPSQEKDHSDPNPPNPQPAEQRVRPT